MTKPKFEKGDSVIVKDFASGQKVKAIVVDMANRMFGHYVYLVKIKGKEDYRHEMDMSLDIIENMKRKRNETKV